MGIVRVGREGERARVRVLWGPESWMRIASGKGLSKDRREIHAGLCVEGEPGDGGRRKRKQLSIGEAGTGLSHF